MWKAADRAGDIWALETPAEGIFRAGFITGWGGRDRVGLVIRKVVAEALCSAAKVSDSGAQGSLANQLIPNKLLANNLASIEYK